MAKYARQILNVSFLQAVAVRMDAVLTIQALIAMVSPAVFISPQTEAHGNHGLRVAPSPIKEELLQLSLSGIRKLLQVQKSSSPKYATRIMWKRERPQAML